MEEMSPTSRDTFSESPGLEPGTCVPSVLGWALFFCTLLFKLVKRDPPVVAIRPGAGGRAFLADDLWAC